MQKRQAIEYETKWGGVMQGVIINATDKYVMFCEVKPVTKYTKCYDDMNADKDRDCDNVRLKDSPPPFRDISNGKKGGVYAVADIQHPYVMAKDDLRKCNGRVLDNGKMISVHDMHNILNHPWLDQKQKEMRHNKRLEMAEAMSSSVKLPSNGDYGMNYGE